ncbi:Sec-independent protein translocase subunit TatA [Streptomyces sp. NPDC059909]|uniref:Sec-independent protein translocase subunit TatA n=1 Tax=Streptomyces sp. NPDC059909 TaxID=3346998 RepID=UPI00365F06F2
MFGKIGAPEILLILVVLIMLFGAKRLPGMARSLGQSMRILKSETKAMRDRNDEAHESGDSVNGTAIRAPFNAASRPQGHGHSQEAFGTR